MIRVHLETILPGVLNGILAPVIVYLLWLTFTLQRKELAKQQELIHSHIKAIKKAFEQTFLLDTIVICSNMRRWQQSRIASNH